MDRLVLRVSLDQAVQLGCLEHRVLPEPQARRESPDRSGRQGLLEMLERLDPLALRGRVERWD